MWQRVKNVYHRVSAYFACIWYRFPADELKVIGITGTDGKTTTTHLIHHILRSSGKKASMVSSVFAEIAGDTYDTGFHVTSPNEWMMQKFLRVAVNSGDKFMVLEVTSHALDQHRADGIRFNIGVLTNVTHEHLDYHKSYLFYVKTKEKLLTQSECIVVNKDDDSFGHLDTGDAHKKMITYGIKNQVDVSPKTFSFSTSLPGEYNRYNCLAAIATCRELGLTDNQIQKGIKTFKGVKGRFEIIPNTAGLDIIIDFAHTPNAIKNVLSTLKPRVTHKLIHIFGSASERDVAKRPIMGQMSSKYANFIILTEEDYRNEDVNQIIDQIARGCVKEGAREYLPKDVSLALKAKGPIFFRIPDRKLAIGFVLKELAVKGDSVILTGKAHEKSLCRGTIEYPWSEHKAVKDELKGRLDA